MEEECKKKKMKSSPTSCSVQVATTIRYTRALRKRTDRRRRNEKWRKGEREREKMREGEREQEKIKRGGKRERSKHAIERLYSLESARTLLIRSRTVN